LGDALFRAVGLPPNPLSAILMPNLDRPKPSEEDEAGEQEEASDQENSAEGDENASSSDGVAIAELPAPDSPNLLTPDLQPGRESVAVEPGAERTSDAEAAAEIEQAAEASVADTPAENLAVSEKPEQDKAEAKVGA